MDRKLKSLAGKAHDSLNHAIALMKDKIIELTGSSSITIMELSTYIQTHSETKRVDKELLGTTYSFYHLQKEDASYHLEMKNAHVLQLDVYAQDHHFVSYRSFRDQSTLSEPIKIPKTLLSE